MKWAVVTLTALGLAAALCAAILVVALQKNSNKQPTAPAGPVTVLVSTDNLPAMAQVQTRDVTSQTMPADKAPAGYYSENAQVIGQILALPMVSGQAYSPQSFVSPGDGRDLVAHIPPGKRAVGISITNYAALQGLLYPGCSVDVILSWTAQAPPAYTTTVGSASLATTVLQNVQVLAIDNTTVNTTPPAAGANTPAQQNQNQEGNRRVILLVDTRQAKLLQLAASSGGLSLAIRNPLDNKQPDDQTVSVYQLTADNYLDKIYPAIRPGQVAQSGAPAPSDTDQSADQSPQGKWNVQVISGDQSTTQSFPSADTQPSQ